MKAEIARPGHVGWWHPLQGQLGAQSVGQRRGAWPAPSVREHSLVCRPRCEHSFQGRCCQCSWWRQYCPRPLHYHLQAVRLAFLPLGCTLINGASRPCGTPRCL